MKEERLYKISDVIGFMSRLNVDFLLTKNTKISSITSKYALIVSILYQ